jgi:hypothetical protein
MVSRMSRGMVWNHPPRRMLFLLVFVVVGTLTVLSIFLLLRAHDLETTPQVPLFHPIKYLTLPARDNARPLLSVLS